MSCYYKAIISICFLFLLPFAAFALDNPVPMQHPYDYGQELKRIQSLGKQLVANYSPAQSFTTIDGFGKLYFNEYEGSGMETAVAAVSPTINTKTESLFAALIGSASSNANKATIEKNWLALSMRLNADVDLLNSNQAETFTQAFLQALGILLREGFEALIIVTALLAYLKRANQQDKAKAIYYGISGALLASILTAILFVTLFKNLGANREVVEGFTMLFASAVLFYVSYWLLSKRESQKWQSYIKEKISHALTTRNMFALGLAAFLAVYREGAETILFYQALFIHSKGETTGIIAGIIAASFSLILIYVALQKASSKIPYRLFFSVTACFLYYMAFSFIGNGILELQEAGLVDISPINHMPTIPALGLFPAWQNVTAQLIFLIPSLGFMIFWYIKKTRGLAS